MYSFNDKDISVRIYVVKSKQGKQKSLYKSKNAKITLYVNHTPDVVNHKF